MRVLVVEDDAPVREMLQYLLGSAGHEVEAAVDGIQALEVAKRFPPEIVITDWMMPNLDGEELCRRLRAVAPGQPYIYVIFLTARIRKADILRALEAGADDYMIKPFDPDELSARVRVGERIVRLESVLRHQNEEMEQSLRTIRRLKSLLPICMHCKRIRTDQNYWQQIEAYIHEQTGTDFTHGVCPECLEQHYPEYYRQIQEQQRLAKAQQNSEHQNSTNDPPAP